MNFYQRMKTVFIIALIGWLISVAILFFHEEIGYEIWDSITTDLGFYADRFSPLRLIIFFTAIISLTMFTFQLGYSGVMLFKHKRKSETTD